MKIKKRQRQEAELDITSFMNLMIVLVPVLLLNMVFSHITIIDLKLPNSSSTHSIIKDGSDAFLLEIIIRQDDLVLNYGFDNSEKKSKSFSKTKKGNENIEYDYLSLSEYLQQLKRALINDSVDKKDILILAEKNTEYQTIISTMDAVRSYRGVVAASVIDAELFPIISLGDAPKL